MSENPELVRSELIFWQRFDKTVLPSQRREAFPQSIDPLVRLDDLCPSNLFFRFDREERLVDESIVVCDIVQEVEVERRGEAREWAGSNGGFGNVVIECTRCWESIVLFRRNHRESTWLFKRVVCDEGVP